VARLEEVKKKYSETLKGKEVIWGHLNIEQRVRVKSISKENKK
jgi:hypothetical protein